MSDKEKLIEIFTKVNATFDEGENVLYINDEIMLYFDDKDILIKYKVLD